MLKNNDPQEQLEFLKREEVRTMAKDIAKLHAKEAREERERIVSLREIPRRGTKTEPPPPPPLMPHEEAARPGVAGQGMVLPKARTRFEKILIRLVVAGVLVFILFNGIAFGYWYFTKKVVEVVPEQGGQGNQVSSRNLVSEPEESVTTPPPSPVVFFETPQEKTIELAETEDLLSLLSSVLKEEHQQGFTRILIKKQGGDVFLNTREFLGKAGLAMSEPLLSLLKEDFMLFLYSSPGRRRLGFVGELTQTQGAQDILKSWEQTMEQDTKLLWDVVGQKGKAYVPFFRQTSHKDILVRFQTFSVIDFGIVYALLDSNLVLTTSFESTTAAVDHIIQSR